MKYFLAFVVLLFAQGLHANLVVSEVLSNEPGGFTTLEWIELYNNSDSSVELSEYILVVDSVTFILPKATIRSNSYQVICRKLFAPAGGSSFEAFWGNGSQVWGDSEFENSIVEPIEISFLLRNDSGEVLLLLLENIVSIFNWTTNSADGFSWERKFADSTQILQSKSQSNSTPGYINSVTLVEYDIAIEAVSVVLEDFKPFYTFQIANRGHGDITDGVLHIFDSTTLAPLYSFQIPSIANDILIEFEISFELSSVEMYQSLFAIVESSSDLRSTNDSLPFTAVSQNYPPLLISEFLANPQPEKETEWIEIYNRSSEFIDLQNWMIGDALKLNQITDESILILPNEYVVITDSEEYFLSEYPFYDGVVIELVSWAVLNDGSDEIRLIDSFDVLADSYFYTSLYDNNYTVVRELENETYDWGRSSEQFGSPGDINILFQYYASEDVSLNIDSKYISPNADGYEDKVTITINVPLAESYTLKLYDIKGNVVKKFYDDNVYVSNKISWDGYGDNNTKLPIGVYILYLTTDLGKSAKETVVIAR